MKASTGIENLSSRLRFALKTLGVSQTELARRITVKPQIIQYLCSSASVKSRFTFEIAEALEIDALWLATGKGVAPSALYINKSESKIPVLSLEQIRDKKIHNKEIADSEIKNWLSIREDKHQNSFALVIDDKSMAPRFEIGTTVVIDPSMNAEDIHPNNRFALAYLRDEDFLIFRQLEISDHLKVLLPLNGSLYKKIELKEKDIVLGFCKEARWRI